ncbi:hypothetical protein IAT38_000173 [Cryptococcus sp. DSM 104549]
MSDPIELKPMGSSIPPLPPRHPAAQPTYPPGADSSSDAQPGTLGRAYRTAEEKAKAAIHLQEGGMDAVSVFGVVLSSWFTILAIPLALFPRILIFFSQTAPPTTPFSSSSVSAAAAAAAAREDHYDALTPLESTLCLTLALGLVGVALISLFILVPTYEPPSSNPARAPLLGVLVGLVTLAAAVTWNAPGLGGLGVVVGGGNVVVALWGWWVVVFGGGRGQMTKVERHKKKVPERLKKL